MNLEQQVSNVCKIGFYHISYIATIRNCLNQKDTETLVHAFISSTLDHCNSLLSGISMYLIDELQRVHNAAARLVTCTSKFDSIASILRNLHWLPVKQRISYKILLLTYKALNGVAPQHISDLMTRYKPARTVRSSNKLLLQVTCYRLKTYGYKSFKVSASVLGNSLPFTLKKSIPANNFKSSVKTFLFKQAFG